jgi:hypothetical protein
VFKQLRARRRDGFRCSERDFGVVGFASWRPPTWCPCAWTITCWSAVPFTSARMIPAHPDVYQARCERHRGVRAGIEIPTPVDVDAPLPSHIDDTVGATSSDKRHAGRAFRLCREASHGS